MVFLHDVTSIGVGSIIGISRQLVGLKKFQLQ